MQEHVEPQVAGTAVAAGAAVAATAAAADPVEKAPSRKLGIIGWLSVSWLTLAIGTAILAPILPLAEYDRTYPAIVRKGIGQPGHLLGGDSAGFDMLARLVYGGRASLTIAFGAVLFGLVVGGLLGLMAGFFKGPVDTVLSTLFNVFLAMPALVLALSLVAVLASSDENTSNTRRMVVVTLALGIVTTPILARITRASTLSWSERDFVKAAIVSGAKPARIIFREVLPNVLPAMFSIALLGVAVAIVAEGSLALLGVGGVREGPTWGNMIAGSRSELRETGHIWAVMAPSLAIFFTVFALNYLGDVVRSRFDVRESVL